MEHRTSGQNRSIRKTSDIDVAHIAFWVEDMDAAAKYPTQQGCHLLVDPFQSDKGPKVAQQIRHFTSPWGMAMEILHRATHMPYEKGTRSRLFEQPSSWHKPPTDGAN